VGIDEGGAMMNLTVTTAQGKGTARIGPHEAGLAEEEITVELAWELGEFITGVDIFYEFDESLAAFQVSRLSLVILLFS
jgi:hypothetical protein